MFSAGDTVKNKEKNFKEFVVLAWDGLDIMFTSNNESNLRKLHKKYINGIPNGYLNNYSLYTNIRMLLTERT